MSEKRQLSLFNFSNKRHCSADIQEKASSSVTTKNCDVSNSTSAADSGSVDSRYTIVRHYQYCTTYLIF